MNLYKKTEGMLYNYNKTKSKIKSLEIDLEMEKQSYNGISAMNYDSNSGRTNSFNSSVENEVVSREKRISLLEQLKKEKEIEIQKIDICLENLDEREMKIVEMRYLSKSKRSNKYIAAELYLSEEYICRIRKEIITNMIEIIFNVNISSI